MGAFIALQSDFSSLNHTRICCNTQLCFNIPKSELEVAHCNGKTMSLSYSKKVLHSGRKTRRIKATGVLEIKAQLIPKILAKCVCAYCIATINVSL